MWKIREESIINEVRGNNQNRGGGMMAHKSGKGMTGMYHSEETKKKISEANKGRVITDEQKKKLSKSLQKRKLTQEHKDKIGAAHRGMKKPYAAKNLKHGFGKDNAFYGRHHTEEAKAKLRANTVRQLSKNEPKKISKPERIMLDLLGDIGVAFITKKEMLHQTVPDAIDLKNKIVFYADGDYWHNLPNYIERDKRINKYLYKRGWTVLRFWEHELLGDIRGVAEKINATYLSPRMQVIYVAGSYRALTEWGVKQNIDRAEAVALRYWKKGYAVFCPHKNSAFMGGACPDETWINGGLEILRRCDAIVMMDGWKNSEGSIAEYNLACELGLEIWLDE